MIKVTVRVLLALVLAIAGVDAVRADPPSPPGCGGSGSSNFFSNLSSSSSRCPSTQDTKIIWFIVGAAVLTFVGWAVFSPSTERQPGTGPGGAGPGGGPPGPGGALGPAGQPPVQQIQFQPGPGVSQVGLRSGFSLPPPGASYVADHILIEFSRTASQTTINKLIATYGLTLLETITMRLTGRTLYLFQVAQGASPVEALRDISATGRIAIGGQVDFLFAMAEAAVQVPANADQYAPQKLNLVEAHRLATGNGVKVAVIDSEVDASHPDLAGAVAANLETSTEEEKPHPHGTGMAGAIVAHQSMLGVAPRATLLTVRAFSANANNAEGTTFNILKGLDWAAEKGARVVNMSFAGPSDPRLREALAKANKKGMVLIAASGNAGAKSPPLFPAADPNVIAVTATDANDELYTGAVRGAHIAVAAPGVDILVPAPDGNYQFTTGTSVAAAEVSGVAALLIERDPTITPAEVRRILMETAKDLGPKGRDREFGAGLVDALKAVMAVKQKVGAVRPGPKVAAASPRPAQRANVASVAPPLQLAPQ